MQFRRSLEALHHDKRRSMKNARLEAGGNDPQTYAAHIICLSAIVFIIARHSMRKHANVCSLYLFQLNDAR